MPTTGPITAPAIQAIFCGVGAGRRADVGVDKTLVLVKVNVGLEGPSVIVFKAKELEAKELDTVVVAAIWR